MNKFLIKLEKSIGKYAIRRLPLVMLILYAVGYCMQILNPGIIYVLSLNPYAIMHGQVWRIVSWLLVPPDSSNLFFMLIALYFYYSIGTTLERTWGTFYFNYYFFLGVIFTILGAFGQYFYYNFYYGAEMIEQFSSVYAQLSYGRCPAIYGGNWFYSMISLYFSTYYINMSIFLAFAATFPEVQIFLFGILPIKVKALGIIYGIILVYNAYRMGIDGVFVIGASLLNFLIFFFTTRRAFHRTLKQAIKAAEYKRKMQEEKKGKMRAKGISKHKCAICGRTDESHPDLTFRFCSKCNGNYEYCQDHLFTHKHVD